MLADFIRTRTQGFRTRSPTRDQATDHAYVAQVASAIGAVLDKLESERTGLNKRVADALSRAAVTAGNEYDEYLTRDALEGSHLKGFESEVKRGQHRLKLIDNNIARFAAVQDALKDEFPEYFRQFR